MEIQDAMLAIRTGILKRISGSRATVSSADGYVVKLLVNVEGVRLKIEPNTTLRGSVYESRMMDLSRAAKEWSQMSLSMRVLSFEDLYGGKLCATLDRQHPRDLFDVKLLLDDTGITPAIRRAFVVYLAGHNRPMNELLDPRIKDIRDTFARQFSGMARIDMSLEDLKEVQRSLAPMLVQSLDDDEKRFLVSLKQGEPEWDLLGIDGLARFPAIQRKLLNVGRMDPKAHASALEKLKRILGV
jgi:hypothetical protein